MFLFLADKILLLVLKYPITIDTNKRIEFIQITSRDISIILKKNLSCKGLVYMNQTHNNKSD